MGHTIPSPLGIRVVTECAKMLPGVEAVAAFQPAVTQNRQTIAGRRIVARKAEEHQDTGCFERWLLPC